MLVGLWIRGMKKKKKKIGTTSSFVIWSDTEAVKLPKIILGATILEVHVTLLGGIIGLKSNEMKVSLGTH